MFPTLNSSLSLSSSRLFSFIFVHYSCRYNFFGIGRYFLIYFLAPFKRYNTFPSIGLSYKYWLESFFYFFFVLLFLHFLYYTSWNMSSKYFANFRDREKSCASLILYLGMYLPIFFYIGIYVYTSKIYLCIMYFFEKSFRTFS